MARFVGGDTKDGDRVMLTSKGIYLAEGTVSNGVAVFYEGDPSIPTKTLEFYVRRGTTTDGRMRAERIPSDHIHGARARKPLS